MNKENSIALDNQLSTQINDTLKSYSSKYKQLKQARSSQGNFKQVLPYKLERAAITIQMFWRRRIALRSRLYSSLQSELDSQIDLIAYENQMLDKILSVYEADCLGRQCFLKEQAQREMSSNNLQCSDVVRKLVKLTLMMQKHRISDKDIQKLQQEKCLSIQRVERLTNQKEELQNLLSGQLQEEEQFYLHKIKQENQNLLKITKQRGQYEKQMREKLVQTCKIQINR